MSDWEQFFDGPTLQMRVDIQVYPEVLNGTFCAVCPGCEWNGYLEQFLGNPLRCHSCGHLTCPSSPYRVNV